MTVEAIQPANDGARPGPSAKIYHFQFSHGMQDLSRAIIKPFLYAVISFGLLLPIFQCAMTRIIARNTTFFGQRFSYQGEPRDLLMGYIARVGFFISNLALIFFIGKVDGTLQILAAAIFLASFLALVPLSILSTFAYRVNHLSWGSNPIQLDVSRRVFTARFLHGFGLTCLTLGLAFPYFLNEIYKTVWGGFRVGPLKTMYSGQLRYLFKIHFFYLLFFVPTLGLNTFWYVAKLIRYFANASWLGSSELGAARAFCDLRGEDIVGLVLLNFLAVVGSLGLATPWAMHHTFAYLSQRFKFYGDIKFELLCQGTTTELPIAQEGTENVPEAV